jgi:Rrf2 family protein
MKVSTKGRYGLRAMVEIALAPYGQHISLKNIAEKQKISESYLEQLISPLRKAGYVKSERGAQGGYSLLKKPGEITVGEILRTLEGDLNPTDCSVVNPEIECDMGCSTKIVWQKMADSINNVVDSITLEDLLKGPELTAARQIMGCGGSQSATKREEEL